MQILFFQYNWFLRFHLLQWWNYARTNDCLLYCSSPEENSSGRYEKGRLWEREVHLSLRDIHTWENPIKHKLNDVFKLLRYVMFLFEIMVLNNNFYLIYHGPLRLYNTSKGHNYRMLKYKWFRFPYCIY